MTDGNETRPPRVEVLYEAAGLIDGDRNISYGTPTQNFTNIADMWTVQFRHMLKNGFTFEPRHVAEAMILLKTARNIADTKRDTWVDIAGYAGCGYEATLPPEPPAKTPTTLLGVVAPPAGTHEYLIRLEDSAFESKTAEEIAALIAAQLKRAR